MSKSQPITIFGLTTCDTTRAARKWLAGRGVEAAYHDLREDKLTKAQVEGWVKELGWEKVLNKTSTTWRGLPDSDKVGLNQAKAVSLLLKHPTLVKRPLLERGEEVTLGFKAEVYGELFPIR